MKPSRARTEGSRAAVQARAPSQLRSASHLPRAARPRPPCVAAVHGCRARGAARARGEGSTAPGLAARTRRRRTRPSQVQWQQRLTMARSSPCSVPRQRRAADRAPSGSGGKRKCKPYGDGRRAMRMHTRFLLSSCSSFLLGSTTRAHQQAARPSSCSCSVAQPAHRSANATHSSYARACLAQLTMLAASCCS